MNQAEHIFTAMPVRNTSVNKSTLTQRKLLLIRSVKKKKREVEQFMLFFRFPRQHFVTWSYLPPNSYKFRTSNPFSIFHMIKLTVKDYTPRPRTNVDKVRKRNECFLLKTEGSVKYTAKMLTGKNKWCSLPFSRLGKAPDYTILSTSLCIHAVLKDRLQKPLRHALSVQ